MSHRFQKYLEKHAIFSTLIKTLPAKGLKTIVLIPAYNEPELIETLNSLKQCNPTKFPTEVIVLINHGQHTPENIKKQNQTTQTEMLQWAKTNNTPEQSFYSILIDNIPEKHAGAGYARKIAMDEAIRRFDICHEEQGIMASLDADTLVSKNYLADLENAFLSNKNLNTVTLYFEHPIEEEPTEPDLVEPIILYELYLRYYKHALASTGFPFAYYTIGSCFAVNASTYVKQGGMNRRQAGEDFYFLNKILPLGHCKELNTVTVKPSSRISDRVPFGTGPAIKKIKENRNLLTYHPKYFFDLKQLFSSIKNLFNANADQLAQTYELLPESLKLFVKKNEFIEKLAEINKNTASPDSFTMRFYNWFDAFKIVKYLNFSHQNLANKIPIKDAICLLFQEQYQKNYSQLSPSEILMQIRSLAKNK
jgi:glycosyltransferase involved in cell wall biosynthesis